MFTTYEIRFDERGVLLRGGVAEAALMPGRHRFFGKTDVLRLDLNELILDVPAELRAVIPSDWYEEFEVAEDERAVLFVDGVPRRFLRPGVHRRWVSGADVKLVRYDATKALAKPTKELMQLIPASEVSFQVIAEYERGVLFVAGRLDRELTPGMHVFWTQAHAPVAITKVDLRTQLVNVMGQDLMTRDKVTLRLTLTAEYEVQDVMRSVLLRESVRDAVYLRLQLAAREYVAGVKLDELLDGRSEFAKHLQAALTPDAEAMGLKLIRVGVKDIVLPGDMKVLLNRVIEAEKEAAAKVILRREDVAAMRSLAQSAKVLEESPGAMRLKEMEALKDILSQVGDLHLVVGDGPGSLAGLRLPKA